MNKVSVQIQPNEVVQYRKKGWRIHHEVEVVEVFVHDVEYEDYLYDLHGEYQECWMEVEEVVRDEWYAATQEFVAEYHANGGLWSYRD